MRIAFYAPLKSPDHGVPSGDRRVSRLLVEALKRAGHQVELVSNFRSLDMAGDHLRQIGLRDEGIALAKDMAARWSDGADSSRPDLWFTYHVYYKSPDWLGPYVSAELGIPYVVAEASHAPKRANGPWAIGHDAAVEAIRAAALVLCPTRDDVACLESLVTSPGKIHLLPPFLDPQPYQEAAGARERHRAGLSRRLQLDTSVPWIAVAAMMRQGDKLSSYRTLARVLDRLKDLQWRILVAGDGAARREVEATFEGAFPGRARFLGECDVQQVAELYAACDISVWPAINEAYGMAMLEAQAAGIPVVSRDARGVPDVVCHGRTGLLAPPDDEIGLTDMTRVLLMDENVRKHMGRNAAEFVLTERSISAAAISLDAAFATNISMTAPGTTGAFPG
jgi:glycosyltransferase involved in cell wall biosynthesis